MAIRFFSDPVRVLSIGRNPGFVNPIRSGPGFVNPIRSDPGFVNPIQSDPIRSDFVNAHFRLRKKTTAVY